MFNGSVKLSYFLENSCSHFVPHLYRKMTLTNISELSAAQKNELVASLSAIVVGGAADEVTAEAMKKANELGVIGIVTGGISSKDLTEFLGYEIGVAITGEEETNITIIATESFGEMPMAQHTFDMMKDLEGQMASINGSTQIRAGVVRPEIMVPHLEEVEAVLSEENLDAGMTSGTRVRVIRAPYFGKLGNVASLPTGLQQLETESKARVMEVEFDDGTRAIVPRANVELIVE